MSQEIFNKDLFDSLRSLTIVSLDFLKQMEDRIPIRLVRHLEIFENGFREFETEVKDYRYYWMINYETIKSFPQFKECLDLMGKIKNITEKGEALKLNYIIGFVTRYLEEYDSLDFSEENFNKIYNKLEDFLFRKTNFVYSVNPIWLLTLEDEELDLGNGLKIRKIKQSEIERLYFNADNLPIAKHDVHGLKYVAEITYNTIGNGIGKLENEYFPKLVTTLRLFKKGKIGTRLYFTKKLGWWGGGTAWGMYQSPFFDTYKLSKLEFDSFKTLFKEISKINLEDKNLLNVAIRRFNDAYEKKYVEDRLVDLIIAFEALFSKDNQEVSYKLSNRVSVLLGIVLGNPKEIFKIMRKAYSLRSSVVHGQRIKEPMKINEKEISFQDFVDIVEEYLRTSIKCFLKISKNYNYDEIIQKLDNSLIDKLEREKLSLEAGL